VPDSVFVALVPSPEQSTPPNMVWIPGGTFRMGSDRYYPEEAPVHRVSVDGFWIDRTPVTNRQFKEFIRSTGHKTFAEIPPDPKNYPGALPHMLYAGSLVFTPPSHPVDLKNLGEWWVYTKGADWRHPYGPKTNINTRDNHTVVHVAFSDALAYARWAGKDLPTEAEWEFAAIAAQSPLLLPRRLIYVVNRRTVVDQATDIAQRVREKLPKVPQVYQALSKLSADPTNPLAISTLRGEYQDNKEWQTDPARAAIVIGTVDMIGSKLLFSGYQSSQNMRPFLAGLLGQDTLLIHDEAHLTPAFGQLIRQIIQTQQKQQNPRPLHMIELSATRRAS
jgi:hypothetical protein